MDVLRKKLFIAALLHDIGKFYQRADKSFSAPHSSLSEESRAIADYICPLNDGGNFGYQHTVWTLQFLDEKATKLKSVPGIIGNIHEEQENRESVFQLAAYHHKPSSLVQSLISLADWWSAGADRREKLEHENGDVGNDIKWGSKRYKKIPLYSIFNGIKVNGKNMGSGNSAFPLKSLTLDNGGIFPQSINSPADGVNEDQYSHLWKCFSEEFDKLPSDTFEGFSESLIYLLKKYTWCIPSNTTDMSNVSLFDHLKTTAAFADCLYLYLQENPDCISFQNSKISIKDGSEPVILLAGDISGIQKFIYDIASKKAAVSLKGRSFYLQLLIDSIIQRFIQHPDIKASMAHVIYSSGGKFYMILPNTQSVKSAVSEITSDIEKEIWDTHKGQLQVIIDYISFGYDIKGNNFYFDGKDNLRIGDLWRSIAEKLSSQKRKKFKNLLIDKYEEFFEPQKVGGDVKVCGVTGIEIGASKYAKLEKNEDDEDSVYVLPIVMKQAEIGTTLKDADYIITHRAVAEDNYLSSRAKTDIGLVGIHNYLFDQKELILDNADFRSITSVDTAGVKRINDTNFLNIPIKGNRCSYGFQFYGGNKQAAFDKNRDKTFDELAQNTYLGVLRMDVDNLGAIFINGLPDKDKSFSAYSTLSFMLDYFFSGYLNNIREKYKDDVNILYSGGDDVFAVGKWDKVLDFAADIRFEFERFVGRKDVSISGGVAIVGGKFPISKAAELAGDAESAAKKDNGGKKNSLNFLGETISWDEEFGYVRNYKERFIELIDNHDLSKGILHKIMNYAAIAKEGKERSYIWHTAYYLSRYMERYKNNQPVTDFCKDLKNHQLISVRNYELLGVAARWAELELRINTKN